MSIKNSPMCLPTGIDHRPTILIHGLYRNKKLILPLLSNVYEKQSSGLTNSDWSDHPLVSWTISLGNFTSNIKRNVCEKQSMGPTNWN